MIEPTGQGRRKGTLKKYVKKIRLLHATGWTVAEIAREIGCSVGAVTGIIKGYNYEYIQ